jgi:hypothetical protein
MDWSDNRPLDTLPFGFEHPEAERPAVVERVRTMLAAAGVKVADDIAKLGCTTLCRYGVSIDDSKFLRLGLAGSGCGMPCFVPPDRYCLVHETIGGLQDGQDALDADQIPSISRSLTPEESIRSALMNKAMGLKGKDADRIAKAADLLSGRDLPDGLLADASGETPEPAATLPWVCPEHDSPDWNCRYCVAAGIVGGEGFEPVFLTSIVAEFDGSHPASEEEEVEKVSGHEIATHVEELNKMSKVRSVELYARVARWSRRLTRE